MQAIAVDSATHFRLSDTPVRWILILLSFMVGIGLVAFAIYTDVHWRWIGLVPSAILQVGLTFALAGMLFVLEQNFSRTVRRDTERIERKFEERTREIEARLDAIGEETKSELERRYSTQDEALDDLERNVSFTTVSSAFTVANDLNATKHGRVTVRATTSMDGYRLTFGWEVPMANPYLSDDLWDSPPELRIILDATSVSRSGSFQSVELRWEPGQSAVTFGAELTQEIQAAGLFTEASCVNWEYALRELHRALKIAIDSRRAGNDSWDLGGELIELVDDQWAISTSGIHCHEKEYFLAFEDIPPRPTAVITRRRDLQKSPADPPPQPAWVSIEDWKIIVDRSLNYHPRNFLLGPIDDDWRPMTSHGPRLG
jgi:hypothetical protein